MQFNLMVKTMPVLELQIDIIYSELIYALLHEEITNMM